jgi:hypothetical protein
MNFKGKLHLPKEFYPKNFTKKSAVVTLHKNKGGVPD